MDPLASFKAFALFVAAIIGVTAAWAADAGSCGELPCRTNGLAYVSETGGIVIMPGEAFSVELKIEDGKIIGVTPRWRQNDLPNSIELEFKQSSVGLMLEQVNHVNATIKTDGYLKLADGRLVRTSMCPLQANLRGIEMWPDRIEFVELRNFRIVSSGGSAVCD